MGKKKCSWTLGLDTNQVELRFTYRLVNKLAWQLNSYLTKILNNYKGIKLVINNLDLSR